MVSASRAARNRRTVANVIALGQGGGVIMQTPLIAWDKTYYDVPALTNVVTNSGGVNAIADMPGMAGVRALRMKPNGSAIFKAALPAPIDLSAVDYVYFAIVPRDTNTASGTLQLNVFFGSDTGLANRRQYGPYTRGKAPGEPFIVAIPLKQQLVSTAGSAADGWNATGGTIDWTAINTIQIGVASVNSNNLGDDNYFYVSDVFASAELPKGRAMLGFDLALQSQYDTALPILNAAGIKATFYVKQYTVGTSGVMTLAQLQALSAQGHKIACHSFSKDLDLNDATNFPTAASIAAEIQAFEAWASANSLNYIPGHNCLAIASPWLNSASFAREQLALAGLNQGGIQFWRESTDGFGGFRKANHRIRGLNPRGIYTTLLSPTTNITDINSHIQMAADRKGLVSLYTHSVDAVGSGNGTSTAILQAVVDKIVSLRSAGSMETITPDRIAA